MLSFLLKPFLFLFDSKKNNKVTETRDRDIEEIEKEYVIHPYILDNLDKETIYKLIEDINTSKSDSEAPETPETPETPDAPDAPDAPEFTTPENTKKIGIYCGKKTKNKKKNNKNCKKRKKSKEKQQRKKRERIEKRKHKKHSYNLRNRN